MSGVRDSPTLSISWQRSIGLFYKVQSSLDLVVWRDETQWVRAKNITGRFEDVKPSIEKLFYRVMRSKSDN